jgi:hypothetical protein
VTGRDGVLTWIGVGALLGGTASLLGPHFDANRIILAAIRVLNSQRAYRDFPIPEGPISAWVLVPFLWLAPSIGWAVLLASAALNAFAVACAWRIVLAAGGTVAGARVAAVLTAIWFLPAFGTYYLDHLAYAWVLGALTAYLVVPQVGVRGGLCGVLLALAYHTKQTVGAPALAALLVTIILVDGRSALRERANAWIAAGLALGHLTVLAIIGLSASLPYYYEHAVLLPLDFANEDGRSIWRLPAAVVLPFGVDPLEMLGRRGFGRIAFYPVVLAVYAAYAWLIRVDVRRRQGDVHRTLMFAGLFLVLTTTWCSILLGRLYAHVTFGIWCVVGLMTSTLPPRRRWGVLVFYALLGVAHVAALNWPVGGPRTGSFPALRPLLIANHDGAIDMAGAFAITDYLRGRPGGIAILTDAAEIIPISLRQPTFEPAFDFTPLNFPRNEERRARWEQTFEKILDERRVRYLVWSDWEPYPHHALTPVAQDLVHFIATRYSRAGTFGRYVLLERIGGTPSESRDGR